MRMNRYTVLILLFGCSGSSTPAPEPQSTAAPTSGADAPSTAGSAEANPCEELATVCHGHDADTALVTECHLVGHDGNREQCTARFEECMSACQAAAGAHEHEGH